MSKEYAIYPFKYMNITQRHDQGNHTPHWKNVKDHSDKPWDEACKDSGRSYFEPQNDFVVEEVIGLNTSKTKAYTNAVRLKSVNKLTCPYGTDYLYLTLTHMNEDNLKNIKVGQILKVGSKVLLEGTDGQATGNHFHITANFGKYYGLLKNNNGKWCFTYEKSLLPNEAFYLNKKYTTIKNSRNYIFKEVPKEENKQTESSIKKEDFFPKKGYFSLGDTHKNVEKIADFMYKTFPMYTNKKVLGNYYGPYLQKSIKEFQKRTGLEQDESIGPKTLAKLKKYGFKE